MREPPARLRTAYSTFHAVSQGVCHEYCDESQVRRRRAVTPC